jgi:hypothetical protein
MGAETDKRGAKTDDGWTPETERLLQEWHHRVYAAQSAYYLTAEKLRRRHYLLGIPAVLLSSIAGTAIFADLGSGEWSLPIRLMAASVSILAAVLAGLQTFLRPSQAAAENGFAADWFAAIRRDIEQVEALPRNLRGDAKTCLDSIRKEINKAGQKAPELDETLWASVAERFGVREPPLTATKSS